MNLFFYSLTLAVGVDQFSRSSPASPHQVSSIQISKARRTEGKFQTGHLLSDTTKRLMSSPKCRSVEVINNPVRPGSNHREVNCINYR